MAKKSEPVDIEALFPARSVAKFLSAPMVQPRIFDAVDILDIRDSDLARGVALISGQPITPQRLQDWRTNRRPLHAAMTGEIAADLEFSIRCLRRLYALAGNPYPEFFAQRYDRAEAVLQTVLQDPAVLAVVRLRRKQFAKLEKKEGWKSFFAEQERRILRLAGREQ
jgi:hypothetical protein